MSICNGFFVIFTILSISSSNGFLMTKRSHPSGCTNRLLRTFILSTSTDIDKNNPLGLTPELQRLTSLFQSVEDDKLRYKQLLFIANQLKPMNPESQIPENQVRGCLSTVYVDGTTELNNDNQIVINFTGDSDGLLTKGLVALLVRGLSGNTAAEIQKVDPGFIKLSGIEASLTPSRNNGFLNMLAAMKKKALELEKKAKENMISSSSSPIESESNEVCNDDITDGKGPIFRQIMNSLQLLKPTKIELSDVSYKHAGHREAGENKESHFELYIVSDAFKDLNLVKRHKLIYMMLGDVMPKIHALQIQAKTTTEVQ